MRNVFGKRVSVWLHVERWSGDSAECLGGDGDGAGAGREALHEAALIDVDQLWHGAAPDDVEIGEIEPAITELAQCAEACRFKWGEFLRGALREGLFFQFQLGDLGEVFFGEDDLR